MPPIPADLQERLLRSGQCHVLHWWDELTPPEQQELLRQLQELDFEHLAELHARHGEIYTLPASEGMVPLAHAAPHDDPEARRRGEDAIRRGEVAALVVAGGQGSRLGFDRPKGMFPVGPISQKSLFQIHAEKVLAIRRRYGCPLPFLVMTSTATHDETIAFFQQNQYFGLHEDLVLFFCQGTMPALELATGRLLMESRGRIFTSPDGHGGTLTALAESGLLAEMRSRGIKHFFYFQVDNPLVKIADPVFLGHHLEAGAEVSSKVVAKEHPDDRLGNFVVIDGRCQIIEYSDLPDELARRPGPRNELLFWAGSPAIHIFESEFLGRVTRNGSLLPFHLARKKVAYLDESGRRVQPEVENALKFERFIFDVLPLAERWTVVETTRPEEFVPLKNAEGAESPAAVRRALSNQAASWLEKAGIAVPRAADGALLYPLEVSPLLALDAEELAGKVDPNLKIEGPTYLN